MEIVQALTNLGINEKQAKVYLASLELGSATVRELSEKSGVKRTSIYNFLEDLKQKGLITEIKEKDKILLIAEDPHIVVERAKKQMNEVESVLPDLMSVFSQPGNKPKVKYYEGLDGIKKAYDDIITTGETIYGYSDWEQMFATMPDEWPWQVPERRVERKIKAYYIGKDGPWGKKVKAKDKEQMRQTKLVKDIKLDTEINIYGKKVAMISYRRPYAAVIVEDRAIAESMRSIWQIVWDKY
jgi:sugar-specific transcriptional regulator TrmB